MTVLLSILIVICTIVVMECVSWCIHKYLFHGPLWFVHKSHHQKSHSFFEWNDLFALLFAGLSLYLMFIDKDVFGYRFFIGLGISVYGVIYFIIHDWFVHRRFKTFKSDNGYLKAVRKAHKIHHKNQGKEKSRAFGLLFVRKGLLNS
ncbi:sterol desaturase family protein [Pedobacter sp. MC2016-05]|uniref:sterol desaturase family protein n=1 Tax=Pedobacter sp. MC2016-05 TaxID=2994474 RepID=UPI002247A4C7|nr:sterol desaturase family protein [Pedobacter sp. MC2016-05]MCX2475099.1 sterol desaturase family protein [Pedobacter sp. MC2016-05]